jgi:hypothetical protein|tara:strand:- start:2753 stop:3040 length:288 start_codon:yes stop_codon:yes gene_type:complete
VAAFFPREEGEEEEANAEDLDRMTPLFSERNAGADADDDAMRKPLIFVYTRRDRRREKSEALFSGKNVSKNATKISLKQHTRQRALTRRQKRDHE